MKVKHLSIIAFMASSTTIFAGELKWEFKKESKGTKVWVAEKKGEEILYFRGEKILNIPIEKAMGALFTMNVKQLSKTKDLLAEAKRISTSDNLIFQYEMYDMPWPISNREFLLKYSPVYNTQEKSVTVNWTTEETHPDFPKNDNIRAKTFGYWKFTANKDGTTKGFVEVVVDPRGALPKWMVNMVNADWAPNTIAGIESQAPNSEPHEPTVRLLQLDTAKSKVSH